MSSHGKNNSYVMHSWYGAFVATRNTQQDDKSTRRHDFDLERLHGFLWEAMCQLNKNTPPYLL